MRLGIKKPLSFLRNLILCLIATMSNLIQNGGFETASGFCPEGSCISSSPQWIAPWTLEKGADFQLVNAKKSKALISDSTCMALNTAGPITIGQNVPVTPGSKYIFTIHLNGNQCNNFPGSRTGFIRFGGITNLQTGATITRHFPFSHNTTVYKKVVHEAIAASSNMFIEIGSTTPGNCGPIVEGVSLMLAPNSLPTTVPSDPVIPNPTSNPVTSSSPQNPMATTSTANDALPTIVSDSQESNTFTPDSSSVLEDVNTSSTQTPDPSSSIAPSTEISTGAIVGISIGAFFLSLGFVAALYFFSYKRGKNVAAKSKASVLPFAGESMYLRRFKTYPILSSPASLNSSDP
jgi:hypothetical protein